MLKVNNKDTQTTSMNIFKYTSYIADVSIVDLEYDVYICFLCIFVQLRFYS